MSLMRAVLPAIVLSGILSLQAVQGQSAPSPTAPQAPTVPTLHVTSQLVFLDVTVLDAKGHPVVKGLTKDDFTITQDKKPQRIFSFEAPGDHVVGNSADDNPSGKAPVTIFVLDQLNSTFPQMAYIRYCVHKYLAREPSELKAPAEVMVLGNTSLEMVQGYTRNKQELLSAVDHLPGVIPYKLNPSFFSERFLQSINGLRQIALENSGIPGRKNIVWIGHGGPGLYTADLDPKTAETVATYVHKTTNLLVDARMSLFLIYPGLEVATGRIFTPRNAVTADETIGDDDDPFSGDVNFGVFVNETGGQLFYNRNDLDQLIRTSVDLGSHYYTLTYQPPESIANGKFLRVRVAMRNPNLQALTKAGYFSPDKGQPTDPRLDTLYNIAEALQTNVPFEGLGVAVTKIVHHRDTNSAEISVDMDMKDVDWKPGTDGKSEVDIGFAGASLSSRHSVLASKTEAFTMTNASQDPDHLKKLQAHLIMTLRTPRQTQSVRIVVGSLVSGRIGSVDISRKMIDTAPDLPTPEPKLLPQPAKRPPQ